MNKYQLTTEKKKRAIIDAAMTLFGENGYSGVSVSQIAALAHVSQVSIYNYFGSKEALIAGCVDMIMGDTLKQAAALLKRDAPFIQKLEEALSLCTRDVNVTVSEMFSESARSDPALMELLARDINRRKTALYSEYIELGKQEGALDSDIPTDTYLRFVDALNTMGDATQPEHLRRLFFYGLLGKG